MDKTQFWQLIEQSKNKRGDCDAQAENLEQLLLKLEADEIAAFDQIMAELRVQSYRWDLWAVASIINGFCSDDGFEYFRLWVIAQGREYFEAAIENPERAAEVASDEPEHNECEALGYAANEAHKQKTGKPSPVTLSDPAEPAGEGWNEEDLPTLYPRLCGKFG